MIAEIGVFLLALLFFAGTNPACSRREAGFVAASRIVQSESEDILKICLSILKKLPAVLLAISALPASAQAPTKVSDGALADTAGMTLYVYDRDPVNGGKSTCNGSCSQNWVPLMVIDGAKAQGDYTIITRDDGRKQWAYKGKPLYQWTKDQKPGDKTGEGVNKVWHVATP